LENLTVVGLSQWMADRAKESKLFTEHKVLCLPNTIDTNLFKPVEKKLARDILGLPQEKKLIAFGAMDALSDVNKGYNELFEAIAKLKLDDIELVVFGSSKPKDAVALKYRIHYLGHFHDDVTLKLLYSTVDVMIVPSLQENLSNVIMESLSCGTPVVAFNIGGNSDMIDHKINGYLAKPLDTDDLAQGIEWVLTSDSYNTLSDNAREKVLMYFDSKVVAKKYMQLYKNIKKEI